MTTPTSIRSLDWAAWQRQNLERTLKKHLRGEVRFDAASRALYATDASLYEIEPLGVVIPKSRDDLHAAAAIALEQRVPIVPRGGGTSLSGQAIGPGLVLDTSKHLTNIVDVNVSEGWARVEPGVVLARFNERLAPMGHQFGPDVATADRATLGGMIGNNSAGSRSIRYGKTIDHVLELDVVLADGSAETLRPLNDDERVTVPLQLTRWGIIHRQVESIVSANKAEIARRFPRIVRRVSGYNLDALLPPAPLDPSRLFVGSEGTLGVLLEAKVRILPSPRQRGLAVLHFARLEDALRSLDVLLPTRPSAVELIDDMIIDLARKNHLYRDRLDFVQGRPAAIFLVEYQSDDPAEITTRFAELKQALVGYAVGAVIESTDPQQCERIWRVRRVALPLLLSLPGGRKPITFVEDTAVAPEKLPEFVERFREILSRYGTTGSFYGHASVGCLHIRPLIDLRTKTGSTDMARIADDVCELVMEFGGAMSGEHGDGIARSQFNRRLFGDELYAAFQAVKKAFDPENLFNPGKIVDAPAMTEHLREDQRRERPIETIYAYGDGGPLDIVERCNGNGLCRREGVGVMCPSYQATKAEEHSPRGRANLLRWAIEGKLGATPDRPWASPELADALDLCLGCKACKTECPSSVDVAKLKSEYLQARRTRRGRSGSDFLWRDYRRLADLGSRWAPLSNWLLTSWPARLGLEIFLGIDRRRRLPRFHRKTLERWFRSHQPVGGAPRGKVVLIADCFTNHHDPAVGRDAVWLLETAGYQVHLAPMCCGRAQISKGFLHEARQLVDENIRQLTPYAEDGMVILGTEPSCLFTLTDEWRDLVPGEETTLIARQAKLVESWLEQRWNWGGAALPTASSEPMEVLVHGHCHQKAALAMEGSLKALSNLAGVTPTLIDAGCCGMAGAFGYEHSHYEMSKAIAGDRLLPALRQAPRATVVAGGFSCRTQVSDLARRRALHPVQLIRRRIEEVLSTKQSSPASSGTVVV